MNLDGGMLHSDRCNIGVLSGTNLEIKGKCRLSVGHPTFVLRSCTLLLISSLLRHHRMLVSLFTPGICICDFPSAHLCRHRYCATSPQDHSKRLWASTPHDTAGVWAEMLQLPVLFTTYILQVEFEGFEERVCQCLGANVSPLRASAEYVIGRTVIRKHSGLIFSRQQHRSPYWGYVSLP